MTGHDPTLPSPPIEADPVASSDHDHAALSDDRPHGDDGSWTDAQRIAVGVIVAVIAVIVLVLVVFVFSGPDEETVPAPTVPITAAPLPST